MVEFVREYFDLSGWRAVDTYDSNNSGWYDDYMALEQTLNNLDNTLSAFGGAGFRSISGAVDRLWDALEALAFCKENLEYELFVEIDEKLMKRFGEMTDEFATLDVRNIRTPNILGLKGITVNYDAEGNPVETTGGTLNYLTLENFTGAAGFVETSGYKEQCVGGFSDMLAQQYNYYMEEGLLDEKVTMKEYLDQMMPHEFEYFQYTEVWKKVAHSFLDVLVVPTMIEAVTGVEFITGDHLTDNEQAGKAVQSLIQAVSIGMTAGGAYSKGLTYVTAGKLQSSQVTKYVTCKVMKSVAEDGVMNMVTTELTEHDCGLAAGVLIFASLYVGMQEAPDFIDSYVESGALAKNGNVIVPDVAEKVKADSAQIINAKNGEIGTYSVGDIAFMDTDDKFLRYIQNRTDVDVNGYFDIIAHGTPDGIQIIHNGQYMVVDHRTAARLIKNADGYNGQGIRLLSCNTGALDNGFAQNLANKLNVEVCAPTNYLWATQNGDYFVAGMTKLRRPDMNNLGIFKVFTPGGN